MYHFLYLHIQKKLLLVVDKNPGIFFVPVRPPDGASTIHTNIKYKYLKIQKRKVFLLHEKRAQGVLIVVIALVVIEFPKLGYVLLPVVNDPGQYFVRRSLGRRGRLQTLGVTGANSSR